jgi:alkaline phosphatase
MRKSILVQSVLAVVLFFSLIGCSSNKYISDPTGEPKNVILIIGDGMGLSHLYAAMSVSKKDLNITRSNHIGFSRTQSYDDYITDSAASGTAMSTGHKTRNGIIGMRPDSTDVPTLIELSHRKGLAGGVVSTSAITHATPASFVAHCINRGYYEEIAKDFLITQPDVMIGGGFNHFGKRNDSVDLVQELRDLGYLVALNSEELLDAETEKLAGLLAPVHMPKMSEGRGDMLSYSSIKAMETLNKNKEGFFLMIEGSQIDWAAHDHNTIYIVEETLDLDRTIGVVLDFAERVGETLVIVTADHETGGMTLTWGDNNDLQVGADYSTDGHTGIAVPVFAFGPGADQFTGFYQNTEIFKKIKRLLKL